MLAAGIGMLAGCDATHQGVTAGTLRVVGSDVALPVVRAAADSFVAYYKRAQVTVEGGGTVAGLEALINKQADVAVLSREPLTSEREAGRQVGVDIALYPFAYDGLALIVHRENPVYALSFSEARALFSGQTTDWKEVGGKAGWIRVYTTGVENGATEFVKDALLGGGAFVEGAGRATTTAAVADSVARHPDAIGYAGMAELDDRVKALPLSPPEGGPLRVLNMETVFRKEYPLVRTFYFGTRGIPRDDLVSGFVSFVMSNRGQRIVAEKGLVPATVPVRFRTEG
jgi:phosphate transport system substrate-binding protein